MRKARTPPDMQPAIAIIESRLSEPMDVDALAGRVHFSKTHFQRLFHQIVGEPVMEYVKRRRLEEAGAALLATNQSVLEIALCWGYQSHEGFTRAFSAQYGMPPKRYRKMRGENSMRTKMNECLTAIEKTLTRLSNKVKNAADPAEQAAKAEGARGKTLLVVIAELREFAKRAAIVAEDTKGMAKRVINIRQMSEEIFHQMRCMDDIGFQMNILRFFGGIEIRRVNDVPDAFWKLDDELAQIAAQVNTDHLYVSLLNELIASLRAEIKQEAVTQIHTAVTTLRAAAQEGTEIAAMAAAAGHPVFHLFGLAAENKAAHTLRAIAAQLENFAKETENTAPGAQRPFDARLLCERVNDIGDSAFFMNINAFNAAIETARSDDSALHTITERLYAYAGMIQKACHSCREALSEAAALLPLVFPEADGAKEASFAKQTGDILFQGSILSTQLGLEAARAKHDRFLALAQQAEAALPVGSPDKKCLAAYGQTIGNIAATLRAEAETDPARYATFAYIAQEYAYFAQRISAVAGER